MKINIKNDVSFVDEQINIKVTDLKPETPLKITLKLELPWCPGEIFTSYGIFQADKTGVVNLESAIPLEGTYQEADPMGLLYSLNQTASIGNNIADNIRIEQPICMNLYFETPFEQQEALIKRIFKSDDVIIKEINDGFAGQLFYKKHVRQNTILMLGGSDGQMESLALMAGPLASRGFHVLIVSYFGTDGLPDKLEQVPLEYFEKIFHWIENNPITQNGDIYLHGTSKGGELALLLASRYPQIKRVVAVEPHTYCFQALDGLMNGADVSSWSYNKKSLPFIKVENDIFFEDQKSDMEKGIPFGFASTYRKSIEKALNKEEARIKVENSEADILLICGEKDNIWNSHDACLEIVKHLKDNNYRHCVELLSYPDMGHPLPIPYIIPIGLTLSMPMNGGIFSSGGTIAGNAKGQYLSFKRTVDFFHGRTNL